MESKQENGRLATPSLSFGKCHFCDEQADSILKDDRGDNLPVCQMCEYDLYD